MLKNGFASTKRGFFTTGCLAISLASVAIGQASKVLASEAVTDSAQVEEAVETDIITPTRPTRLEAGEFSVGGITIGSGQDEILEILGEPNQIEEGRTSRLYKYDGLELLIGRSDKPDVFVEGVETTLSDFCTPSGVCPGDTVRSVMEKLGITNLYTDERGTHLTYWPHWPPRGCWMNIYLDELVQDSDVTIQNIELACAP